MLQKSVRWTKSVETEVISQQDSEEEEDFGSSRPLPNMPTKVSKPFLG